MVGAKLDRAAVRAIAIACVALPMLVSSSSGAFSSVDPPVDTVDAMTAARQVKSWHYQLQNIDPSAIARSSADMVVIDYSGESGPFSRAQVEQMRRKPDGSRRVVLAYMSIGEAESYRWYWARRARAWLGPENPQWPGNYGVRFWHPNWQAIIFEYTDKILAAGFDGVYLDKVDEYVDMAKENPQARALMIAFVKKLAEHARARKPGFLVVPQNAEELLTEASYRAVIDGLGKEDLLYGETKDKQPNQPDQIEANVAFLKRLTADRKPVFAVEYLDDPREIEAAKTRLLGYGFVPYFADRALDHMRSGDLPEPGRKPGKR
jgi:cysteinyl-tRNA synthetase